VILHGGRIYTGDPAVPHIAALPITRDGRVARGVEAWEGDGSQVSSDRIDLDGRTVLPGLADAHVHFRSWAAQVSADVDGAQRTAHARGVTQVHDFEASGGFSLWQQLAADRSLTLRVVAGQRSEQLSALLATGLRTGFGDAMLRVGPVLQTVDEMTADELARLVRAATAGGLAVALHPTGDVAARAALDALEATREAWSAVDLRPRIEDAQNLPPDVAERCAASGIAPAFGSGAPTAALDPLAGIAAAVAAGVGRAAAVARYTTDAAFAAGWERRVGRLAPGFEADLVVLDDDPFTCPLERIAGIGVIATMVGGRFVCGRPPW
jgi:predicted amidohydrolase YtcJ